jgi:ribonucleoside-triphosphate reductase
MIIDWNDLSDFEKEDNTSGSRELACTAGVCEVVDLNAA